MRKPFPGWPGGNRCSGLKYILHIGVGRETVPAASAPENLGDCHFAIWGVKILLWVEGKGEESDLFNSALAGHLFLIHINTARLGWGVHLIKKRATTNRPQSIYSVDSVLSNFPFQIWHIYIYIDACRYMRFFCPYSTPLCRLLCPESKSFQLVHKLTLKVHNKVFLQE